jgi:hypothetical protein
MLTIFFNAALNSVLIADYAESPGRLTRQLARNEEANQVSTHSDVLESYGKQDSQR